MIPTRTFVALALLLAATVSAPAAPRTSQYAQPLPVPPPPFATGGFFAPRPYTTSPYSPSGSYRSPFRNDTTNSIEYQMDMGAGSGRY